MIFSVNSNLEIAFTASSLCFFLSSSWGSLCQLELLWLDDKLQNYLPCIQRIRPIAAPFTVFIGSPESPDELSWAQAQSGAAPVLPTWLAKQISESDLAPCDDDLTMAWSVDSAPTQGLQQLLSWFHMIGFRVGSRMALIWPISVTVPFLCWSVMICLTFRSCYAGVPVGFQFKTGSILLIDFPLSY